MSATLLRPPPPPSSAPQDRFAALSAEDLASKLRAAEWESAQLTEQRNGLTSEVGMLNAEVQRLKVWGRGAFDRTFLCAGAPPAPAPGPRNPHSPSPFLSAKIWNCRNRKKKKILAPTCACVRACVRAVRCGPGVTVQPPAPDEVMWLGCYTTRRRTGRYAAQVAGEAYAITLCCPRRSGVPGDPTSGGGHWGLKIAPVLCLSVPRARPP